jgi:hypothetical protein
MPICICRTLTTHGTASTSPVIHTSAHVGARCDDGGSVRDTGGSYDPSCNTKRIHPSPVAAPAGGSARRGPTHTPDTGVRRHAMSRQPTRTSPHCGPLHDSSLGSDAGRFRVEMLVLAAGQGWRLKWACMRCVCMSHSTPTMRDRQRKRELRMTDSLSTPGPAPWWSSGHNRPICLSGLASARFCPRIAFQLGVGSSR